jgi:hypothetical protein
MNKFFNGTASNIATKWWFDVFSKTFSDGFLHPCPCSGVLKVCNSSIQEFPQMLQFLVEKYRVLTKFFDDEEVLKC